MMKMICKPILIEAEDDVYEEKNINKILLDKLRKTHKKICAFEINKDGNIEIYLYKNNKPVRKEE